MIEVSLVALATFCLAWAAVRVTGAERGTPLVQLLAFTPYAALLAVAVLVASLTDGRRLAALVAGAAAVALIAVLVPRCRRAADPAATDPAADPRAADPAAADPRGSDPGGSDPGGSDPAVSFRVLSANLLSGGADAGDIIDLVRRRGVDVLAVQELTPAAERALDAAGLADLLPHRATSPVDGYPGSGLYSRHPIDGGGVRVHRCGMRQAMATVAVPAVGPVAVESAHPCAPHPRSTGCWRRDLADQPRPVGGPLRILLGDFNATLDHGPMRRLIADGYRDAAATLGRGYVPTWPFAGRLIPWTTVIPKITLDHVLVDRRAGVVAFAAHPVRGTDHHAVYAEVALPAA